MCSKSLIERPAWSVPHVSITCLVSGWSLSSRLSFCCAAHGRMAFGFYVLSVEDAVSMVRCVLARRCLDWCADFWSSCGAVPGPSSSGSKVSEQVDWTQWLCPSHTSVSTQSGMLSCTQYAFLIPPQARRKSRAILRIFFCCFAAFGAVGGFGGVDCLHCF